ncbi:MAG TPA: hypothetical protein VJ965_10090 [Anaerolineales bacterium]|nr:hypothetical protein [Anaerolineales bacterium]
MISIETCWELAQRWYTGRAARDWQRPDADATQHLFTDLGLTGEFWKVR